MNNEKHYERNEKTNDEKSDQHPILSIHQSELYQVTKEKTFIISKDRTYVVESDDCEKYVIPVSKPTVNIENHGISVSLVDLYGKKQGRLRTLEEHHKSFRHFPHIAKFSKCHIELVQLQRKHCELLFTKFFLEITKCFKFVQGKSGELLHILKDFLGISTQMKLLPECDVYTQMQNTVTRIASNLEFLNSEVEQCLNTFTKIHSLARQSYFYTQTLSHFRKINTVKCFKTLYYKICTNLDSICSKLVALQAKYYQDPCMSLPLPNALYRSYILLNKLTELIQTVCTHFKETLYQYPPLDAFKNRKNNGFKLVYYIVLLPPAKDFSINLPNASCENIQNLSNVVKKIAWQRSRVLTERLCTATYKVLQEFMESSSNFNVTKDYGLTATNVKALSSDRKNMATLVKTFYKQMLSHENDFFNKLISVLELNNNEILLDNMNALYRKTLSILSPTSAITCKPTHLSLPASLPTASTISNHTLPTNPTIEFMPTTLSVSTAYVETNSVSSHKTSVTDTLNTAQNRRTPTPSNTVKKSGLVPWDCTLGPPQKNHLYALYMKTLWSHVKELLPDVYTRSIFTSDRACRMNNIALNEEEVELISLIYSKFVNKENSPETFLEVLSCLVFHMKELHCRLLCDQALANCLGIFLKDRFRFVENASKPFSPTFTCLLQYHRYIEQFFLSLLKFKPTYANDFKRRHQFLSVGLHELTVYHSFLDTCLLWKRQQFLFSATWEQFFVVSSSDLNNMLPICRKLLLFLKENFEHSDGAVQMNKMDAHVRFLEIFEEDSMKQLVKQISQRSKAVWQQHMTSSKVWKRKGTNVEISVPSTYINVALQTIFSPVLDNIHIVSASEREHSERLRCNLICQCISSFVKTWMNHILDEKIMFSRFGVEQLDFDFNHFVTSFESSELRLNGEELSEVYALPSLADMKNAIILLACQPDSRKKEKRISGKSNLLTNNFGSSSSVMSQESVDSFHDAQFDDVIKAIELHDKERWLELRVKGGKKKHFLCLA